MKQPAVYIMVSRWNGTLYTGVTSDLVLLVWFEQAETMEAAICREKQIKVGSRGRKLELIEKFNPEWRDLFDDIVGS
jgi:predicted GIY-YIG superfamily endonuclease